MMGRVVRLVRGDEMVDLLPDGRAPRTLGARANPSPLTRVSCFDSPVEIGVLVRTAPAPAFS